MSTYILNPNDTIVFSDSIVVKTEKMTDVSQNSMSEVATNCQDVIIVLIICVAIVLVALIVKWALWSWKEAELKAHKEEFQNKTKKEEDESDRKQKATSRDRTFQQEDSDRKRRDELMEKKLKVLKDLCYGEIEKKESDSTIQGYLTAIDEELKSLEERLQTSAQNQTIV